MYDLDYARYFWRILFQMDQVMKKFRGRFCEKASSVYFFWGSFDMAIRLSSGHTEPGMEGAYHVQLSAAYDHPSLRVYIFPYEVIRTASDCFFETTFEAGTNLAEWDRGVAECSFLLRPAHNKQRMGQ